MPRSLNWQVDLFCWVSRCVFEQGHVRDLEVFAPESAALLALDDRQGSPLLGVGGVALHK
jgi:hypothetical protein